MTPSSHHRLIILGAGTAGLSAFKQASELTDDIVLIDPGPLGTTCARVGCMPSKALLQVAREVHSARALHRRGVLDGPLPQVDTAVAMDHVRALRDRFTRGPVEAVEGLGARYRAGAARFLGPDRIALDGETLSADAIIVATGSRPVVPAPWRALGERLLTSDTVFEQAALPARVAVVGLGALGCELGQALAMLGATVHGFGRDERIAGIDDPAVTAVAREALEAHLVIHTGHEAEVGAERTGRDVRVRFGGQRFEVDAVLAAVGRRPAVEALDLGALGLALGPDGLPEIDPASLRAGDTPVYFAGDVNRISPLMHEGADEGRLAAWHALHPQAECLERRTALAIVFTEPQIARCGRRRRDLPEGALVGASDFGRQGRSVILGERHGLMHVYAAPDGCLLGAEMVCAGAEHLAHELAWLVQRRIHVTDALQLPFYHPVLEEGLRTALQDVRRQLPARERRPDLPLCGRLDDPLPGI